MKNNKFPMAVNGMLTIPENQEIVTQSHYDGTKIGVIIFQNNYPKGDVCESFNGELNFYVTINGVEYYVCPTTFVLEAVGQN
jgi:hypothetical protein